MVLDQIKRSQQADNREDDCKDEQIFPQGRGDHHEMGKRKKVFKTNERVAQSLF